MGTNRKFSLGISVAIIIAIGILASACNSSQPVQNTIVVSIQSSETTYDLTIPMNSIVRNVLKIAQIQLGELDRVEPPLSTLLKNGDVIRIIRVREDFIVKQVVIPYENQIIRNESLPEGDRRLIQSGVNGLQEITYRYVYDDGIEVKSYPVKSAIVKESIPSIVMVGSQTPFTTISIPGRIAYLAGGNAWVMDGASNLRLPVVTTGDLDGHVFELSFDGKWLLFTRTEPQEDESHINSLWVANVDNPEEKILDLKAFNVVHYAEWVPGSTLSIAYSTVEKRSAAPGWQANNDLWVVDITADGSIEDRRMILDTNSGGVYGWWGTSFAWSPDGTTIAYSRPDSVGLIDPENGDLTELLTIIPYNTGSEWAWVPGISWGSNSRVLYSVNHAPSDGMITDENSPYFNLIALPVRSGGGLTLSEHVGMFAYPATSPSIEGPDQEKLFHVAFLRAIFPTQSETSRYQLFGMDRDGSNPQLLFPSDGTAGIEPQRIAWSPHQENDNGGLSLAFLNQGNLWILTLDSRTAQQVTGDGLITRMDWK